MLLASSFHSPSIRFNIDIDSLLKILFPSLPVFWDTSCLSTYQIAARKQQNVTAHSISALHCTLCRLSAAWCDYSFLMDWVTSEHGQWTTIRAAVAKIRLNQIQIIKKFDSELQLWGWMMNFFTNWTGSEWARQSLSITLTKNRLQQEMMLREWAMCWKLLVNFKKRCISTSSLGLVIYLDNYLAP